ncbi:Pentatricopeptide repeat-containing protein, chloroplastic [Sesamum angolense]|uniref:Pentatricopeptide repeat-containing protein, chloroplastic n=1 Tax=Sesamum angolense TaxID=2727404 RepID=A0AAE1VWS2_9LAMI|nr:Pentatricopeptide repeat-containing protein, chloroplastic [Sesamum angolense]
MTTTFYAEFFPRGLIFTQQKLSTRAHHSSVLVCRSHSEPQIRNYKNPVRVKVSTDTRPHQLPSYNDFKEAHFLKLLHRSCKAGNYDEGLYFLECMVNLGHKADVILCTKLIKGFFNSKSVDKAEKVMRILERYGEPDIFAYNAFISGLCKVNQIDTANEVLSSMRARGFAPDVVTYNIMIGSLCNRGKLNLAMEMLDQLIKDNCQPTVITYTILIEATILEGGIGEAMKLFDEMLSRGLQPDMYTYNTIIRGMCRGGMMDEAFKFVRSLTSRGCKPDVISYNILLRALLSQGKWDDGEKLMIEMFSAGCEPNVVTYSIMISGLCRDGQLDEAINLLKLMMDEGLTPDTYTYDPLISALCKEGRLDLAIAFLDYMISSGCFPDIVNYNTILSALCKNGNADEALEVFGKLAESGCPPDVSTYNTMVSALWNNGDRSRALRLVSEMIHKGINPDEITYNSLISCLCRDGMVDSAIELLGDMKNSEFLPTVVTYNIVLLGLCKAHRIGEAISVLEEMVKKGCHPNETTYVLLIEGIGFAGWRAEAMELANSLYKKNVVSGQALRRLNRTFPIPGVYGDFNHEFYSLHLQRFKPLNIRSIYYMAFHLLATVCPIAFTNETRLFFAFVKVEEGVNGTDSCVPSYLRRAFDGDGLWWRCQALVAGMPWWRFKQPGGLRPLWPRVCPPRVWLPEPLSFRLLTVDIILVLGVKTQQWYQSRSFTGTGVTTLCLCGRVAFVAWMSRGGCCFLCGFVPWWLDEPLWLDVLSVVLLSAETFVLCSVLRDFCLMRLLLKPLLISHLADPLRLFGIWLRVLSRWNGDDEAKSGPLGLGFLLGPGPRAEMLESFWPMTSFDRPNPQLLKSTLWKALPAPAQDLPTRPVPFFTLPKP